MNMNSSTTFLSPEVVAKRKRVKRSSTKKADVALATGTGRRSSTKEIRSGKRCTGGLGPDDAADRGGHLNQYCHHQHHRYFIDTLDAVKSYLGGSRSKCFDSSGGLVPFDCNWYDMFLTKRLGLEKTSGSSELVNVEYTEYPIEFFASLAQSENSSCSIDVTEKFEKVLLSLPENLSKLSAANLLILLSFFSFFPDTVDMLKSKNILQNLVGSILAMLTEKKDCARLTVAIAILGHVVEHHSSMSGILSESNISQLLKLCTTRALYPTAEPNNLGSAKHMLRSEFEIAASRLVSSHVFSCPLCLPSWVNSHSLRYINLFILFFVI